MGKQVIQGLGRGENLVRREQQDAVKLSWQADGLGWANSDVDVVPYLLLNPFLSNRCQI
jgi:hypothetical protein